MFGHHNIWGAQVDSESLSSEWSQIKHGALTDNNYWWNQVKAVKWRDINIDQDYVASILRSLSELCL